MPTRPKSAKKTHAKPPNRRSARRRESSFSVTPLATQTSATGADAVIPVSVTGEGSSAKAVIPVEVETSGKKRRKRTAVVPIAVERSPAHTRRRTARTRPPQAAQQRREPTYWTPWRSFASEAVSSIIASERAALELGIEYSQTAMAFLQALLWPILRRPMAV